jgi:hypothetical protein
MGFGVSAVETRGRDNSGTKSLHDSARNWLQNSQVINLLDREGVGPCEVEQVGQPLQGRHTWGGSGAWWRGAEGCTRPWGELDAST